MLCSVCREGLEGIHDPQKTRRLGQMRDFPEILRQQLRKPKIKNIENEEFNEAVDKLDLQEHEKYVFGHHVDYASMLRSMQLGCVACTQFSVFNDENDINPAYEKLGAELTMLVYVGDPLEEFAHELVAHDGREENDRVNSAISYSTASADTWAVAQSWLKRCLDDHEICRNQKRERFIPARLLELNIDGDEKTFRLVSRAEVDLQSPPYCVTACPLISSRTFRDAFEIIERLGVRYLWIDRLCIVQDSAEDWRVEALTMQTVFRHGFLNIAALGSADDEGGCFHEPNPSLIAPTILDLGPRDGKLASFYRLDAEDWAWQSAFVGEPLLSRAWVLQERILATRTLYFGSKQVFWECYESNCCETIPKWRLMLRHRSRNPSLQEPAGSDTWKILIDPGDRSIIGATTGWLDVVGTYCQCSLSSPDDKLVALSGLAKHMGGVLTRRGAGQSVYLAGLWQDTMPESLLWKPKARAHRPPSYRAPSWSWAALDGDLNFVQYPVCKWHVNLVNAMTTPRAIDPAGELTGGTIWLRGPLVQVRGLRRINTDASEREAYNISSFHHIGNGALIDGLGDRGAYLQFDTGEDFPDQLTLLAFNSTPHKTHSYVITKGLALVFADETRSCYRRVGYIWLKTIVDFTVGDDAQSMPIGPLPMNDVEIV
ncbi:Uu.00g131570.m01.CDS01 [Anthostomella pinea]|uniref:Uu.00g131570.m01.CDS01 n=1 Tax=Anthostomella pinea TaxID=933095 RepID=A0AAI8VIX9_9PEZI|nr:Uu.00g131570.m01.CDS01 [Anthostomella pinea]